MKNRKHIVFILLMCVGSLNASIYDYLPSFVKTEKPREISNDEIDQNIPYEVATMDEKFINEAALLTGLALSELDSCQHRVVLKLQTECQKLNDEQVSKLAVMLLNCQSAIEGRPIYQCTEYMSLRECTSNMDPDIWNSYHIMTNRARAVCYSVRQQQFRGLTEMTVNKLMHTAHEQLKSMSELGESQEKLQKTMLNSIDSISEGQDLIQTQQKNIQKAQLMGQLAIENNIQQLVKEKALIKSGNEQIAKMTMDVRSKLDQASTQIELQSTDQRQKHNQILQDLMAIQKKAEDIWARIETSTNHMIEQSVAANRQYEVTINQLQQVNATVQEVFNLVSQSRAAIDSKLSWLSETLGGTGNTIDKLYLCFNHIVFMIFAMIFCAFLNAPKVTRYVVVILVPINLVLALQKGPENSFELPVLTFVIVSITIVQFILFGLLNLLQRVPALTWRRNPKYTPTEMITTTKLNGSLKHNGTNGSIHSIHMKSNGSNGNNHENSFSSPYFNLQPKIYSTPIYEEEPIVNPVNRSPQSLYNERPPSASSFSNDVATPNDLEPLLKEGEEAFSNLSVGDYVNNPRSPLSRSDMFLSRRSRSRSNTPLLPAMGSLRRNCTASTRTGNPCKNSSLPGRDFCYRHQSGDSIVG